MSGPTDSIEQFIVVASKNSTAVFGPADKSDGACYGREEWCRATGWHHKLKATFICQCLNEKLTEIAASSLLAAHLLSRDMPGFSAAQAALTPEDLEVDGDYEDWGREP
jgi:hypothetical protein